MQFSCSTSIINQQTNVSAFVTYLQEAYTLYNRTHNTNHFRIYFPELNPMERVWSGLKAFVGKGFDSSMIGLKKILMGSLGETNLPRS
jgi:hypothetical protein